MNDYLREIPLNYENTAVTFGFNQQRKKALKGNFDYPCNLFRPVTIK
jgi:hypothetical protein